jgi:hypothetical protein
MRRCLAGALRKPCREMAFGPVELLSRGAARGFLNPRIAGAIWASGLPDWQQKKKMICIFTCRSSSLILIDVYSSLWLIPFYHKQK